MGTKNSLVNEIKEKLYSFFPHTQKIEIKIHKDENRLYDSSIQVQIPGGKGLYAHKKDVNMKRSLNRSSHAIIRQLDRLKTRWDKRHHYAPLQSEDFQESA